MDYYQVAMQMEGQGRAFYLSLQEKAVHPRIKHLFGLLAEEELEHYETFRRMSINAPVDHNPVKRFSAEKAFQEMIADGMDFTGEEQLVEAYQKAKHMEDQTAAYYKACLSHAKNPEDKVVLLKLYYEEKKHSLFLEHLIELITDPELHVASAEWHRPNSEGL